MKTKCVLVVIALLVCAGLGCARGPAHREWQGTYEERGTDAILAFPSVTLIFRDALSSEAFSGSKISSGESFGTFQVAGGGTSSGSVALRSGTQNLTFVDSYANGVNNMSFEGHSLIVKDGGDTLTIGSQNFDLTAGGLKLVVEKNGHITVQDENAAQ